MDFFGKLNAKNTFGMFEQGKGNNIVNIICGVLLIILIIVLIVCLVRKNDNFSNQKENEENNHEETHMYQVVNDLDPLKDGCPFSRKMSELLAQNNNMLGGSKVKKITMEHPLAKQFNVTGTPTILCTKTGKKSVGFKQPLDKVMEDLKADNNNNNTSNTNSKRHKLVGRPTCPFCLKAYKLLDELNIEYDKIDSNSPEGIQLMKNGNNGEGVNGVPYMLSADGQEIIGFDESKLRSLKN